MPREISATIRLKMNLGLRLTIRELQRDLPELLRNGLGDILPEYSDAAEVFAIDDPTGVLSKPLDIGPMLANERKIAIEWEIADVLAIRPDLTDDEAWAVLQQVLHDHDSDRGINWTTIENEARYRFGPERTTTVELGEKS